MSISGIAPIQSASIAPSTAVQGKGTQSQDSQTPQDTVQLSATALAALVAKPAESTETYAQTLQEAAAGDTEALALLAKA